MIKVCVQCGRKFNGRRESKCCSKTCSARKMANNRGLERVNKNAENIKEHLPSKREYSKQLLILGRKSCKEYKKIWRENNPEKLIKYRKTAKDNDLYVCRIIKILYDIASPSKDFIELKRKNIKLKRLKYEYRKKIQAKAD